MIRRWRSRRFWRRVEAGKKARLPKYLNPTRVPVEGSNPFRGFVKLSQADFREWWTG
jgi:hypothetical protein